MAGHPAPKGDDCNQAPLPGYPKTDNPKSPSPPDVNMEKNKDGTPHPSTSEASGSDKYGTPEGETETNTDKSGSDDQGVDKKIAAAEARKKELQETFKKLQEEAIMAEKQQVLVERNQEVEELENQIQEMQLRLQVAKQSANPTNVPPVTRSASVSSIPMVSRNATPANLNGSNQVFSSVGAHHLDSFAYLHGSTPNLAASSAASYSGATLMAPLTEKGRSSSINLPCNDYQATSPYDIIRSSSAASAVAGLGAVPKQRASNNDGKLPEHFVFRPGANKVDVTDIEFEEFCHGYGRMLQTMIGDVEAITRRLAYFVLITELAARHDWEDVREFHQIASLEVTYWSRRPWDDPFTDLHRFKFASSKSVGGAKKEKPKNKGGSSIQRDQSNTVVICRNHNFKDNGCTFVGCEREHACFYCWRKNGSLNDGHKGKDCVNKPKE